MRTTNKKIVLEVGETTKTVEITNNYGLVVCGMLTVAKEDSLPNDQVIGSLTDVSSVPYVEKPVQSWFQRSGGSEIDSKTAINVANDYFKFKVKSDTAVTEKVVFSLTLFHENTQTC